MSAQNAIQLATAIQSKVGSSLISSQNLLPRGESAGVMTQAGASSLGVFLLRDLYEMQHRTYECVEKVASILQSQLDLAEEKDRRERDQLAEELKEKNKLGGSVVPGAGSDFDDDDVANKLDEIDESIDKGRFSELLTGGLTAALLAPGALKSLGKSLGAKLLKGTFYAAIAGFIADPIINYVDENFDLELTEAAKKDIKLSMIGAAAGFGLAGIPGAIIGATAGMMAKVGQYVAGTLNAEEINDSNFAGTAIGGAAGAMFGTAKLAAYIKGGGLASIGATTKLGIAMGSLPVLIGVGAAVALGVGAVYLTKKIDEYQEKTLNKLHETTAKLDKQMGEWAAREEEGLFERFGINLGKLSALGEAQVAAAEANEQVGQNKEKFLADEATVSKLGGLVSAIMGYSDDALTTILQDQTKGENFFSTLENLKAVAAKGGFGADSPDVFEALQAMSDRVQNHAIKLLNEDVKLSRIGKEAAKNKFQKNTYGGDQFENLKKLQLDRETLLKEKELKMKELEAAKIKLAELKEQGIEPTFFGENEAEITSDLIKKLEKELDENNRNATFTIGARLRRNEAAMQKFGTINGLLYNLDELRELYKDDKGRLQAIIERSINQTGSSFISAAQDGANAMKTVGEVQPIVFGGSNNGNTQIATQENYIKKLDTQGDPYFARESYTYGAI